jgi:hypothetical protein
MEVSSVVDSRTGQSKKSNVRTSTGAFFGRGYDDVIKRIEKRIAQVTMIPMGKWGCCVGSEQGLGGGWVAGEKRGLCLCGFWAVGGIAYVSAHQYTGAFFGRRYDDVTKQTH